MLDVIKVVLEFDQGVLYGGAIALFDQAPAGHAWFDGVTDAVEGDVCGQFIDEFGALGAGADGAHFAFEDVQELGEFVYVGFAQEFADAGDAVIVFLGPDGAVPFGFGDHGAEFVHPERAPAFANSLLGVEDGAGGIEVNSKSQEGGQGGQAEHPEGGRQDIEDAVDQAADLAGPGVVGGHGDVPIAADVFYGDFAGELFVQDGHGDNFDSQFEAVHQEPEEFAVVVVGDGRDQGGDLVLLDEGAQGVAIAQDGQAGEDMSPEQAGVVIDKAGDVHAEFGQGGKFGGDGAAGPTGTDDEDAAVGDGAGEHQVVYAPEEDQEQGCGEQGDEELPKG